MTKARGALPTLLVAAAAIAMAVHGPIPQLPDYHAFADQSRWLGIPHAADVLSNVAFLAVGVWAWITDRARRAATPVERRARATFIAALFMTAAGSAWYHWAPDNTRLLFDRVPIAVACAALLCAAHARCAGRQDSWALPIMLLAAIASVAWWFGTEAIGLGDLRPYLLLQAAPLVLVPLWQWEWRRPKAERFAFGIAIALYAIAKACELADRGILDALAIVSGHTLKHLAAALAAIFIVRALRAGDAS